MSDESRKNLWQRIRGRLRENPPLHGQGGAAGPVMLAVAVALTLAFTACGGGGDGDSDLPTVAEVAPELADFGDLATVHSQPISETFGPDGGSMDLADGSRVEVPEGAFPEPTELTAAIIDFVVEDPVSELRVYHVSTVEEIDRLAAPVVLEIPRPASEVAVAQLRDGEWRTVAVSPGSTTRVSIDHFSSTYRAWVACTGLVFLAGGDDVSGFGLMDFAGIVCGFEPEDDNPLDSTPNISSEDQAWITFFVDDTASELERAGASNEDIIAAKAALRPCLTEEMEGGASREAAMGACEPLAAPYFPAAVPEPEPEPEPESELEPEPEPAPEPEPEPEPEPPPPPEPEPEPEPSVAFVATPTGTMLECRPVGPGGPLPEECDYRITFTVQYACLTVPAVIACKSTSSAQASQSVSSGARQISFTLDLLRWDLYGPPPVFCELKTNDGQRLDSTGVVDAAVDYLPDQG